MQKQKKGTYNSRGPEKVLQIAAFVLNVEDGVWKGCSKSQRTSNNSKPFIFSNENRETRLFPCLSPGEGGHRGHITGTMLSAGGAEEGAVHRDGGTCTNFPPGLPAFLGSV